MYISESSRAPPLRSFFLYRPICKFRINHYICIGVRGDSSELPLLFIFEGVRYFSGMFPTKTDWPDLWAAAIFENNNCHVSVRSASNQFTTIRNVDSHLKSPIHSYLLFEYIADRNSPKRGLSASGVLVYPYPEQHKTLPRNSNYSRTFIFYCQKFSTIYCTVFRCIYCHMNKKGSDFASPG